MNWKTKIRGRICFKSNAPEKKKREVIRKIQEAIGTLVQGYGFIYVFAFVDGWFAPSLVEVKKIVRENLGILDYFRYSILEDEELE